MNLEAGPTPRSRSGRPAANPGTRWHTRFLGKLEVGWLYQFEMVPSKGTFVETPPLHAAIAHTNFTAQLSFSQVLPEYCVRLVGRDLRTDEELSREWCMTPESPIEALNHDGIALCQIAPPGLEERWCRTKQANGAIPPPECDTFLGASGGAGGQPGSSGAGDAGHSDDPPPAGDDASAGESGERHLGLDRSHERGVRLSHGPHDHDASCSARPRWRVDRARSAAHAAVTIGVISPMARASWLKSRRLLP